LIKGRILHSGSFSLKSKATLTGESKLLHSALLKGTFTMRAHPILGDIPHVAELAAGHYAVGTVVGG